MALPPVPLRDLGAQGIISDVAPFDAPANAWTSGNNVRFASGKVQRTAVFRTADNHLTNPTPMFLFGAQKATGDYVILCNNDGKLTKWKAEVKTEVTPTGGGVTTNTKPFTGTTLGNVLYVNRETEVPYGYRDPTDTIFQPLTGWDATWRCKSLRAFSNVLLALNVTKGSNDYPQMVKWSDVATAGAFPGSWDITDTTKRAGENILTDLKTPIVDGLALGETFFLYAADEVWAIQFIGGRQFFSFKKRFEGKGAINQNCIVEAGGYHYVFGRDDIYRHNGIALESLIDGRVRDAIFPNLVDANTYKVFVVHDPRRQDILFCYESNHAECAYKNTVGCNRAAIYNYRANTWGFMDLPGATSATNVSLAKGLAWSTIADTWSNLGGSWQSMAGGDGLRYVVMALPADATRVGIAWARLEALDAADTSTLPYVLSSLNKGSWVTRVGLDLDELLTDIVGYKRLLSCHPQLRAKGTPVTASFTFGASNTPDGSVVWGAPQTFNTSTGYKIDSRLGGRYLAYKVSVDAIRDFDLSGMNLVLAITGRR